MEEDSGLDSIRQKRMEGLKQKAMEQQAQQEAAQKAEMQLESMLKQLLSPEAKSRLGNVRLVNKQLYLQAAQVLLYMAKTGRVKQKISDREMKTILERITGQTKKEISIKRK